MAFAGDDGREHDPFFDSDKLCGHFRLSRMPYKRVFRGSVACDMPVSVLLVLYHIKDVMLHNICTLHLDFIYNCNEFVNYRGDPKLGERCRFI